MITIAHCCNEIINHYDISTQEKIRLSKLRQQPHSVANPTKAENAHQAQKQMENLRIKNLKPVRHKTNQGNIRCVSVLIYQELITPKGIE